MTVQSGEPTALTATASLIRAAVVGLALGALTAYAQQWLPSETASLANSAGSWMLVAFLLALTARRRLAAAACASLALFALVLGYYAATELRGFEHSTSSIVFWVVVAVVVGPAIGVSAFWVRFGTPQLAAIGGAVPAGLLVGEGIYGLTSIADTTEPALWVVEIVVGVGLFVAIAATRVRERRWIVLMLGVAAFVAAAFVIIYRLDLISLL